MSIDLTSPLLRGAQHYTDFGGSLLPSSVRGLQPEYLAGRTSAWLGVCLMISPVYDISGPDAIAFLNSICVNRDFAKLSAGASRHALICNDRGEMLADGVVFKTASGSFRTYWLAPVIHYYLDQSGLDVTGTYVTDEYFFQIDGPKSLEVLEKVTGSDLHDLRFARNTSIDVDGAEALVHRLGMSGALAYELHGPMADAEKVFGLLRDAVEAVGGTVQGTDNYAIVNHTPAGYPNQYQHFIYPTKSSGEGLAQFFNHVPALGMAPAGSAADKVENFYLTPFDVGWGYLVNFDHDFPGKAALQRIAVNPPRTMVTLEWDADDVADVFASQFRGRDTEPYDPIDVNGMVRSQTAFEIFVRGDYVEVDGRAIGIATGRTPAYWERRMISLASLESDFATEGRDVEIVWGQVDGPKKRIRARVAPFPYYNGEYRNETFDTSLIPRPELVS